MAYTINNLQVFNYTTPFGAGIVFDISRESPGDRLRLPNGKEGRNTCPDGTLTGWSRVLYTDAACQMILSLDNPRNPGKVSIMKTAPLHEKEALYQPSPTGGMQPGEQQRRLAQQIYTAADADIIALRLSDIGIAADRPFREQLRAALVKSDEEQKQITLNGRAAGRSIR